MPSRSSQSLPPRLLQPALLWTTKALQRPIRHLAVGCHVVRAARGDREGKDGGGDKPSEQAACEGAER